MFRWLQREPKLLAERRQLMSAALVDYPLYDPPHRQGPNFCGRKQNQTADEDTTLLHQFAERGRENFQYFIDQRGDRLRALYAFLENFNVTAALNDSGLAAVSAWFPGNGGALVPNFREDATTQAFYQMQTPWIGALRGLNVTFDLGIFLGECLITRNTHFHWKFQHGLSEDGRSAHSGYVIEGFAKKNGGWIDPPQRLYSSCTNDLNEAYHLVTGRTWRIVTPTMLEGLVRDFSNR